MIADVIVIASGAASLVFVAAWAVRPGLRAWIERPKYSFLTAVQAYDRARPTGRGEQRELEE
jgi:hypothetical protein